MWAAVEKMEKAVWAAEITIKRGLSDKQEFKVARGRDEPFHATSMNVAFAVICDRVYIHTDPKEHT